MPFDHAKCPGCGANLDPERLAAGPRGPQCPRCQTPLSFVDLFGVADAFAEEDGEQMTIDDLVPGMGPSRRSGAADPEKMTLDHLLPTKRR